MPQSVAALTLPPAVVGTAATPAATGMAAHIGHAPTFAGLLALLGLGALPTAQLPAATIPATATTTVPATAPATATAPVPVPAEALQPLSTREPLFPAPQTATTIDLPPQTATLGNPSARPRSSPDVRRDIATLAAPGDKVAAPGVSVPTTASLSQSAPVTSLPVTQPPPAEEASSPLDLPDYKPPPVDSTTPIARRAPANPATNPAPPSTESTAAATNATLSPAPPTPSAAPPGNAATSLQPAAFPVSIDRAPEPSVSAAPPSTPPPDAPTAASPAAQVAPALMSLAHAPDGAQRLTLRLEPPELGHVEVSIDRPTDAPARVQISVQRSDTLTLLLRDQPQLQRALDQAGVPAEGRSLTFHLTTPPAPASSASMPGMSGGTSNGADPGNTGHGTASAQQDDAPTDAEADPLAIPVPQHWLRAGLDITA